MMSQIEPYDYFYENVNNARESGQVDSLNLLKRSIKHTTPLTLSNNTVCGVEDASQISKMIKFGTVDSLVNATRTLKSQYIRNNLTPEEQAKYANAIISDLIEIGTLNSLDNARFSLKELGNNLTPKEQSEYANAIISDLVEIGTHDSLDTARFTLKDIGNNLTPEERSGYANAIISDLVEIA